MVTVDSGFVDEVERASRGLLGLSIRAMGEVEAVSATQLRALMLLQQTGPVNLSVFAERFAVATSSASRLVDRLAAAGYLERSVAAHSRREVLLTLSGSGRRLVRKHDQARRAVFTQALSALDPDERGALLRGLRAVNRVVDAGQVEGSADPGTRLC